MKCLILAAGFGSRMGDIGMGKPLFELGGMALIERVVRANQQAAITRFVVVSGHRGDDLRVYMDALARRAGVDVEHVVNEEYRRGNGVSVLKARECLRAPFVLSMSDHLYESSIVSDMVAHGVHGEALAADGLMLAVDRRVNNPAIDLDDVTRVLEAQGRIRAIGKGIADYNCFDTGVFLATPGLFAAIEESIAATGDDSLSGGVRVLASRGRAQTFDIGERYWIDIDSPADLENVDLERLLGAPAPRASG